MKKIISFAIIIALTMISCHRVYVGGGTSYPVGGGYVSAGGGIDTDGTGAAILAASLIGILVGSAIYNDVHSYRDKGLAAYDINIRPKDASIFLDGVYVGKADEFDGSPKFLVVKPGTHTITAKREGFRTYTVRVPINAGEQININKHLEPLKGLLREKIERKRVVVEHSSDYIKAVTVRFNVKDESAKVYFDNTFVGTIGEIKRLHKPLLVETTVKRIVIESKGAKIEFSLPDLIKRQGEHIVIDTQF